MTMTMLALSSLASVAIFLSIVQCGSALETTVTSDTRINCGACKGMFDELDYHISKVPDYKMLELGDSSGLRGQSRQVPYARSETHLVELLEEKVCVEMVNYSGFSDDQNRTIYHRYQNRPEEKTPLKLQNFGWSVDTQKQLRLACDNIAAEIEEELIASYQTGGEKEVLFKFDTCTFYCKKANMEYLLNPWLGLDHDGNPDETSEYKGGMLDAKLLRQKNQLEIDEKKKKEKAEKKRKKKAKKTKKAKKDNAAGKEEL